MIRIGLVKGKESGAKTGAGVKKKHIFTIQPVYSSRQCHQFFVKSKVIQVIRVSVKRGGGVVVSE